MNDQDMQDVQVIQAAWEEFLAMQRWAMFLPNRLVSTENCKVAFAHAFLAGRRSVNTELRTALEHLVQLFDDDDAGVQYSFEELADQKEQNVRLALEEARAALAHPQP